MILPPTKSTERRRPFRTITVVAALLLGSLFVTAPAQAQGGPVRDFGMEAGFLASLNQQRASQGVAPLTLNPSMTGAAVQWAHSMTAGSFLAHAGDIITGTPAGWTKVGENVGRGGSVSSLTQAFMSSSGHRTNIMDPSFTHVGIGVYIHPGGLVYTTHRFAALGVTQPPPPPPTATPIPQPTATPIPQPTATPIPLPQPTATPIPQPTATPIPQPTAIPTTSVQPTPIPTATPQPTPIPTASVQPTGIPTPIPEPTAVAAPVPTPDTTSGSSDLAAAPDSPAEQASDSTDSDIPEELAFADSSAITRAAKAKHELKDQKTNRGVRSAEQS